MLVGYYVRKREAFGPYAGRWNYTLLTTDGLKTYTPSANAQQGFTALEKSGELKPGVKLAIKVTGSKDIGKDNPMLLVDMKYDPDVPANFAALLAQAEAKLAASAPVPTSAAPVATDDVPF